MTNLAQAYGQLNQANLAIEALSKAQALSPENGEVSYSSAIVYSLLQEEASAVHHVKNSIEIIMLEWCGLTFLGLITYVRISEFVRLMNENKNSSRCLAN